MIATRPLRRGMERALATVLFALERALATALTVALAAACANVAAAAPARALPSVLLVGDGDDVLAVRVAAELRASGLRVLSLDDAPEEESDADLVDLAAAVGAKSAVLLESAAGEARVLSVRLAEHVTTVSAIVSTGGDPALVALHVVEAVRAALHEADGQDAEAQPPPRPKVSRRPRPPNPDAATPVRWGGSVGCAAAWGLAGFGPSAQALASLYWLPRARIGPELVGLAPLSAERWKGEPGRASLMFGLATIGLRWEPWWSPWGSADMGASVGPIVVRTTGQPAPGYAAVDRTTWAVAPMLRAGATLRVLSSWRLRIDQAATVVLPPLEYLSPVGHSSFWGRPLLFIALSLQGGVETP